MPYGTHFTSFNALRRRMAQSSESVSPGFIAMISSVNEANKTVDCLVQGSPYYLRGIRYATTFEERPEYIKVRGIVYIRRSSGNKMSLEVEGPAQMIPTITAIADQLPQLPSLTNIVLEGLEIRPSASPAMTIAITPGKARFAGTTSEFLNAKVGETHNAKRAGGTTAPGIPKVGNLFLMGRTYCYIRLNTAPTFASGNSRYDQFELGSDLVIDYRPGTAAAAPALLPVQAGHLFLGSILVRPGATAIYWDDMNATTGQGEGRLFAPISWQTAVPNSVTFSISLVNENGSVVAGSFVSLSFMNVNNQIVASPASEYGSLTPYPGIVTDNNGYASFVYNNTGATKSTRIKMIQQSTGSTATITVYNTDAAGAQLPF